MQKFDTKTFQGLILTLQDYWAQQGCTIVQPLDMETARPVYQFANKKDMMKFLGSADNLDLGSWHVSLQYVGGKWFSGGRSMSKRMEDKLLANITAIVDLSRHELSQTAEAGDVERE